MASAPASATKTTKNVFDAGKYKTVLRRAGPGTRCSKSELPVPPPKPLLIATPCEAGEFPLLVFLHGFELCYTFYSQLIQHIASHGFIVIAPKASLSLSLSRSLSLPLTRCTIFLIQILYIDITFNKYIYTQLLHWS
jgi:hypothetical protein